MTAFLIETLSDLTVESEVSEIEVHKTSDLFGPQFHTVFQYFSNQFFTLELR